MDNNMISIRKEDQILMALVHFFVTKEDYAPIFVQGVKDEIWLEKLNGPYRVIRINSNYIHNEEQFQFDQYKVQDILHQIKKKTLSFNVNALNIYLNTNDFVKTESQNHVDNIGVKDLTDIENNKTLNEIFPELKNNLDAKTDNLDLLFNVTKDINAKTVKDNETFEKIFSKKNPIITYLLIAICILVFLVELVLGAPYDNIMMLKMGANFRPLVLIGDYYRLLSYAFLHWDIVHIACNMYALYIIGDQIEGHFGKKRYLYIYFISAIGGGLLSNLFGLKISAGASGAIFGLMGALVYFGMRFRLYFKQSLTNNIIPVIAINLILGLMMSEIDLACHIGGLIYGYLAAMTVGIPEYNEKKDNINGIILTLIFTAFLIYLLFFR